METYDKLHGKDWTLDIYFYGSPKMIIKAGPSITYDKGNEDMSK